MLSYYFERAVKQSTVVCIPSHTTSITDETLRGTMNTQGQVDWNSQRSMKCIELISIGTMTSWGSHHRRRQKKTETRAHNCNTVR